MRVRPELHPKKTTYMGKEFEGQNYGVGSPGPQVYNTQAATGGKSYRAAPSFSFGNESRFAY